jgi:hypothetical protein
VSAGESPDRRPSAQVVSNSAIVGGNGPTAAIMYGVNVKYGDITRVEPSYEAWLRLIAEEPDPRKRYQRFRSQQNMDYRHLALCDIPDEQATAIIAALVADQDVDAREVARSVHAGRALPAISGLPRKARVELTARMRAGDAARFLADLSSVSDEGRELAAAVIADMTAEPGHQDAVRGIFSSGPAGKYRPMWLACIRAEQAAQVLAVIDLGLAQQTLAEMRNTDIARIVTATRGKGTWVAELGQNRLTRVLAEAAVVNQAGLAVLFTEMLRENGHSGFWSAARSPELTDSLKGTFAAFSTAGHKLAFAARISLGQDRLAEFWPNWTREVGFWPWWVAAIAAWSVQTDPPATADQREASEWLTHTAVLMFRTWWGVHQAVRRWTPEFTQFRRQEAKRTLILLGITVVLTLIIASHFNHR